MLTQPSLVFGGVQLAGVVDPEPAIRQAAAYGIARAAQKGGAHFSPFLEAAVKQLTTVIRARFPPSTSFKNHTAARLLAPMDPMCLPCSPHFFIHLSYFHSVVLLV